MLVEVVEEATAEVEEATVAAAATVVEEEVGRVRHRASPRLSAATEPISSPGAAVWAARVRPGCVAVVARVAVEASCRLGRRINRTATAEMEGLLGVAAVEE